MARLTAARSYRAEPGPFVIRGPTIDCAERRVTSWARLSTLPPPIASCCACSRFDASQVVNFETLLRGVRAKRESADENLVRIFVRNLRRKLGNSAVSPAFIFSRRVVGYRMARRRDA